MIVMSASRSETRICFETTDGARFRLEICAMGFQACRLVAPARPF